jgi:hypothetical protein
VTSSPTASETRVYSGTCGHSPDRSILGAVVVAGGVVAEERRAALLDQLAGGAGDAAVVGPAS